MFVKHKIEYVKDGKKERMIGVLYSDKNKAIEDIINNKDIMDATIQEYPLKNNEKRPIKVDGVNVYVEKERKHMVSFSGGKDSSAMLIRMLELGMRIDEIVFADTKYEFDEMYEYIDKFEEYIQNRFDKNLKIKRIKTDEELRDWIFGKVTRGKHKGEIRGFPLIVFPCTWSRESKVLPLNKVMQGHHRYIGITSDESKRKSKHADDMLLHYPLIEWGWTEEDCVEYLEKIDMMNPLYTEDVVRTGCWWCPKQPINARRYLYNNHPDKWERLAELEREVGKPIRHDTSVAEMGEKFRLENEEKAKDKE